VVYDIGFDWLQLEVRLQNRPGIGRFEVGDDVTASWHEDALAVVPGN